MLSTPYIDIKRLRSTGRCEQAIAALTQAPPSCDEDALEAAICLLVCGQPDNAIHVCQTYPWASEWGRPISAAFSAAIAGGDAMRGLTLARTAVEAREDAPDVAAIYVLLLQKTGQIDEAQQYLDRRWPEPPTGETFLLTLMAEIAAARQDWRQSYRYACGVLALDPDDYRALIAASVASFEDGNIHEALGKARRAYALNPEAAPAIVQIMRSQNKLGDHYAAVAAFDKVAALEGLPPDFYVELAKAHTGLQDRKRAIEAYRAALAADSDLTEAVRGLAAIHAIAGEAAELDALAARYPAQFGNDPESLYWRGLERLSRSDVEGAQRDLREAYVVSDRRGEALDAVPWPVPEPRVRHDYEQLDLLARRGKLDVVGEDALRVLRHYYRKSGDPSATFAPAGAEGQALRRALGAHHYVPQPPFNAKALGENDYGAIEDAYLSKRLAVIDGFLSPEALQALREYCEEATVWKSYNRHGYVGSLVALGFSPRVLLAIADELKRAMPRVIGDAPLLQAWGYKYDQRLSGINMHADFAKVNVNFWLTPDDACLDAASGGMVVYDLPVPKSWSFADYNSDPSRLATYVKLHDAQPLTVPHRANRCVIFDSSLIHVTDRMVFKPGYENRRVNVTLLYGQGLSLE
jgi:tetratricopeptide (TPR) repeat protein